jgi:uncharacterized protein (TIGR00251 family)
MVLECVRQGKEGVYIDLHVVPGSKKEGIDYDEYAKRLRLKISEPAVDGKANKAVITHFCGVLGNCELVSGQKSRKKAILVRGKQINEVLDLLEHNLGR